jgi:hypothetical protein
MRNTFFGSESMSKVLVCVRHSGQESGDVGFLFATRCEGIKEEEEIVNHFSGISVGFLPSGIRDRMCAGRAAREHLVSADLDTLNTRESNRGDSNPFCLLHHF